jgi:hypothetical protein
MTDVTRRITYTGDAARVSMLAQMLEDEGVTVDYRPPAESRSFATALQEIVVQMVATGTALAIKDGVGRFLNRTEHIRLEIDGEPYYGGFPGR